MPVTRSNGTAISATEIQWNCKMYSGLYLYCDYTKGTETSVTIDFTVTDDSEPTSGAFSIIQVADSTGIVSKWTVTLSSTMKAVIPVPLPECTDKVNAIFTFNTPGGSPGTIVVFGNMDDRYR